MNKIYLTQDKVALVDDIDYIYLNQFNWYYYDNPNTKMNTGYAIRNIGGRINHTTIKMHQEVIERMGLLIPQGYEPDHKDRNGLNNQRENLRIVTHSSNMFNTEIRTHNTSGYKGVSFNASRNKWEAYIKINYTKINLGRFNTLKEAVAARLKAEIRYKRFINPVE